MNQSREWPDLAWVPPRSFSAGRPSGPPLWIVWHYTAGHEGPNDAEAGAAYDGVRTDGTSAHFYCDSNSVVQCVLTTDRAHTALYNGNMWGIQYELAGTVQTRDQWLDPVSRATIRQAARQAARDGARWGIPVRKLTPAQVAAGEKGHCGHADITFAFPQDNGNHTDPGAHFPWDVALADVAAFTEGADVDMEQWLDTATIVPGVTTRQLLADIWGALQADRDLTADTRGDIDRFKRPNPHLATIAAVKARPAVTLDPAALADLAGAIVTNMLSRLGPTPAS